MKGQLWEECPRCGNEPVCADCGYCERCCNCGSAVLSAPYIATEVYGGDNDN